MQDYAERQKLLKQIDEGLADIQKIEEEIAKLRQVLTLTAKRYQISRTAMTNAGLVAFRQKLAKLSWDYLELESKICDIVEIVDKVQP